jgi:hypothetical protein
LILGELDAVAEPFDLSPDLRPSLLGKISGLQEEGCSTLSWNKPIPSSVKGSVGMNPLPAPGEYPEPLHLIERDRRDPIPATHGKGNVCFAVKDASISELQGVSSVRGVAGQGRIRSHEFKKGREKTEKIVANGFEEKKGIDLIDRRPVEHLRIHLLPLPSKTSASKPLSVWG